MLFPKEARSAWEGGRKSPLWGGDLEEAMMQDVSGVMRGDPSENTEQPNSPPLREGLGVGFISQSTILSWTQPAPLHLPTLLDPLLSPLKGDDMKSSFKEDLEGLLAYNSRTHKLNEQWKSILQPGNRLSKSSSPSSPPSLAPLQCKVVWHEQNSKRPAQRVGLSIGFIIVQ